MPEIFDDFQEEQFFNNLQSKPQRVELPKPVLPVQASPLSAYYRRVELEIPLPSDGMFLPNGAVEFTMNRQVPVYPMASSDEILLNNPDALLSGYALEKLMESCIPAIKLPRQVSIPDFEVIMVGIRAATHGETMSLTAACPKCGESATYDCSLPALMSTMKKIDPNDVVVRLSDDVIVYVRPYNLENSTHLALVAFEEARRIQAFTETHQEEDNVLGNKARGEAVQKTLDRMALVSDQTIADCVIKVVVPTGEETNREEIYKFITNTPKTWVDKIKKRIFALNETGIDKKIDVSCSVETCGHKWSTEVDLDPANFFVSNS